MRERIYDLCCDDYSSVRVAYSKIRATIHRYPLWRFCPFCGKRWKP